MTDLSGIRVIVFIESDIEKVSRIIEESFAVDASNSSNRDIALSSDQVGYRSVHYVCDLGEYRKNLPENNGLGDLKFEVQIRTVLQHAWAELHHDRAYKFQSKLPDDIQRKLYLHAGLLEIADKGFSDIAEEIDAYVANLSEKLNEGDLSSSINSLSLQEFLTNWCTKKGIRLSETRNSLDSNDLLRELKYYGVATLRDLEAIIPDRYASCWLELELDDLNIFRLVRDWMTMNDPNRLYNVVQSGWLASWDLEKEEERPLFECVLGEAIENLDELIKASRDSAEK